MSSLGIYFGPKLIKIVEAKGKRPLNSIQIPQSTISMGELEEKVPVEVKTIEIVALFKDELRRNKIEAKEATLSLSGRDLIIRTFEIPVIPNEEIASAINFEAKKYIPFKVEELITDFQLKFDKVSRTNLVLFMGIKREALDRYVSILSQLDIRISSIEYSAFSMLRTLKLSGYSDRGIKGVLATDLTGEDEVSFTVLENGFPLFSRDISLAEGPESIGRLKETGLPEALEKLKTEIRVSLDYYTRKFPTKNIQEVLLISHQDYRLDLETFVKESGLAVQYVDLSKHLEKSVSYSLSFLRAFSASLSKTIKLNLKVNLLASKEKTRAIKEKAVPKEMFSLFEGLRFDYRFIILGLLMCAVSYGYGVFQTLPLHKELSDIIARRVEVSGIGPSTTHEELSRIDAKYKSRLNSLDNLIKKQVYLTEILNAMPGNLPQGLWLTHFLLNKRRDAQAELTLEGMASLGDSDREFKAVNKFLENLKQDLGFAKYFNQIEISSLDRKPSEIPSQIATDFAILCKNYTEKE